MSERVIPISPYLKADDLIDLKGHVFVDSIKERIELPARNQLILYNYALSNGDVIRPREHKSIRIFLNPAWKKGHSSEDFTHMVASGEIPDRMLKLRLQVWCKTTRWCSDQLQINLAEVDKKEIYFEIPVLEVKEEITISGFVVRETESLRHESRKASSVYSILSECEGISIQIDEKKEVGSNHLPIQPENIGDLLFDIQGLDNDFELPVIKYSEVFKEYFVKDNLKTVNITFMMAMFQFLDTYLKWLIFKCRYDSHDKTHKGLVDALARYCGVSKQRLVEIVEDDKYSEAQTKQYLNLSRQLFKSIQTDSPIKYSKELKLMIKEEAR